MNILLYYKMYTTDLNPLIDAFRDAVPACWSLREGQFADSSLFYKKMMARLMLIDLIKKKDTSFFIQNAGFKAEKLMYKGVSLSISYSNNLVVVAASSEGSIGVDVEKINPIDFGSLKKEFTSGEWHQIMNAVNIAEGFYTFWTRKESVLKADGRGLSLELSTFSTVDENVMLPLSDLRWSLTSFRFLESYLVSIASSKKNVRVQVLESRVLNHE